MKITIITSSAHRNGTTKLLTDEFIRGLNPEHEVYRFDAGNKNIHHCIACEACHTRDNGCVFKDDMVELNPHLLEADLIVFVTPIYYYTISGQLKNVVDRFYANNDALMTPKKTILMTTMYDESLESAEGANVWFRNNSKYLGWNIIDILNVNSAGTVEDLKQSEALSKAYALGQKI